MDKDPKDESVIDSSLELLPNGLEACTLSLESGEFVIFTIPLPEIRIPAELTTAEREVVMGVLEGKQNREIADDRGTSVNTVVNQLAASYRKLSVSSRWELISLLHELNELDATGSEAP